MSEEATHLADQLRPFLGDEEAVGRMVADLHDLTEICEWFLLTLKNSSGKCLDKDELESLLIELQSNLVDHGTSHLTSIKAGFETALGVLAKTSDADAVHGAA